MTTYVHLQLRDDSSVDWAAENPVLALGEPGWDTTLEQLKIGDGVTAWNSLAFYPVPTPAPAGIDPVDDPASWGADLGYDAEFNSGSAVPSPWVWVNQGTATATLDKGRCVIAEPTAGAAGNQLRVLNQPIPALSTFEAVCKLNGRLYPQATTFGHFMCLRDSVSGKLVTLQRDGNAASGSSLYVGTWASPTGSASASSATSNLLGAFYRYFRIRKVTATSWDFHVSIDGVVWDTIVAGYNPVTHLGTAPTHIGFGLFKNAQVTSMAVDWFRIR